MLTKDQKKQSVSASAKSIQDSQTVVFVDFTKVKMDDLKKLKRSLREVGASFKVLKKRLLNIALQRAGISLDVLKFAGPTGVVFSPGDITSVASKIHAFARTVKDKTAFKVLSAYTASDKSEMSAEQFIVIAKLPSREILLAQVVGMMASPIRGFMYVVDQLSKKQSVAPAASVASTPVL